MNPEIPIPVRRRWRILYPILSVLIGGLVLLTLLLGLQNPLVHAAPASPTKTTASHFMEINYAHDWISVVGAGPNTAVTGTVAGKATITGTTDGNGEFGSDWFTWSPNRPDITPGDIITVTNISGTLTVNPVGAITGVADYNADTVSGTVNAAWFSPTLLTINCAVWETGGPTVVVNGVSPDGGSFFCDFTSTGWDLQPDQMLAVRYLEPDGDQITNVIEPPWVRVQAGHDWVGANYGLGHTFQITVTDSSSAVKATAQITTQAGGGWNGDGFQTDPSHWTPNNPDITAGDWVYFQADDGYTNTIRVGNISGTVDVNADLISGTIQAAWFTQTLNVECHPWGGWNAGWNNAPVVNTSAAPDGSSPYTCQWNPSTEWDVDVYQDIAVFYTIPGSRDIVGNVFQGTPPPGTRYVDGSGADGGNDCLISASPCQTIQHAIDSAVSGDDIMITAGTFTENLTITNKTVSLHGGYIISGKAWRTHAGETIIDGGSNDRTFFIHDGNATLENLTIMGGSAPVNECWGDTIWLTNSDVNIRASIIQDNRGGCAAVEANEDFGPVNLTLESSTVRNMQGNTAVHIWGGSATGLITGTIFTQNRATDAGGAILVDNNASATINNSQVISNSAVNTNGGGITVRSGSSASIANTQIMSNTANSGGGLFVNNSAVSLDNVNISGNQAAFSGGGVGLFQATAVFTDGQIANNTASTGGGLWQESASATLNSVIVQGNQANGSTYAAGGGVDTNNSSLTLNDSVLADNVVQSTGGGETLGGAINNNSGSVAMTNSIIRNNNSQGTPVVQIYQAALTVTNSLVADNQGPGFAGTPTQGSFTNVTIANNNGFGLGIGPLETGDPPVNVTIANSIFWGNGGGDYFCDTSVGTVNCTLSYSDVGTGDTTGTGNLSADPLFVDGANGDYHLGVGSPAVDKGTAVGAPGDDLEGNLRDSAPDMGAFEWFGYRVYLPAIIR